MKPGMSRKYCRGVFREYDRKNHHRIFPHRMSYMTDNFEWGIVTTNQGTSQPPLRMHSLPEKERPDKREGSNN
jgi:hypothetical protein